MTQEARQRTVAPLELGDLVLTRFYTWHEVAIVATPPVKPGNPIVRIPGLTMIFVLGCDDPTGVWRIGRLWHAKADEVVRKLAGVQEVLHHRIIENIVSGLGRVDTNKLREGPSRHSNVLKESEEPR